MDVAKCPSCGTLLGSGVLAGQCPRCLLAGATRGGFTDDPDAQRQFAAAAVLSAVDQPVPDSHTDFDADAIGCLDHTVDLGRRHIERLFR